MKRDREPYQGQIRRRWRMEAAVLLCLLALIMTGCKSETAVTGESTGGGSRPGNTESNQPEEEKEKEPLLIGTNIGMGDIESVSFSCSGGEMAERSFGFFLERRDKEYFLSASYQSQNGPVSIEEVSVASADWDQMLAFLQGKRLIFREAQEETVLDAEEKWVYLTWRGQKDEDKSRVLGLSEEEEEELETFFRSLSETYEPLVFGENFNEQDLGKMMFGAGRIWNYCEFSVAYDGLGRRMTYSYSSNEESETGSTYSRVEGNLDLTQEESRELLQLLDGKPLRTEISAQEEAYLCTVTHKEEPDELYYVTIGMEEADQLVAFFQQVRIKNNELGIPEKASLENYHGSSLLAALDGVKRVDLISAWGAPDSGIAAGEYDVWNLSNGRTVEVSYSSTNGQVYDVSIIE